MRHITMNIVKLCCISPLFTSTAHMKSQKSLIKKAAIKVINRLPLPIAKPIIENLRRSNVPKVPHFMARYYNIKGLDALEIPNSPIRLSNDTSSISRFLYFFGVEGYEKDEIELWQSLCRNATNICEIGGNIGCYAVFGATASSQATYTVYEPNIHSYTSICQNRDLNNLTNLTVVQAAVVGDPDCKEITLHLPNEESNLRATGAYISTAEQIDRPSDTAMQVPAVFGGAITNVDLLKIDAEGAEHQILESMTQPLSQSRPIMLIEVRRDTRRLRNWIYEFVTHHQYEIWAVSTPKLRLVDVETIMDVVLQDKFETRDVLLIPIDKLDSVANRSEG